MSFTRKCIEVITLQDQLLDLGSDKFDYFSQIASRDVIKHCIPHLATPLMTKHFTLYCIFFGCGQACKKTKKFKINHLIWIIPIKSSTGDNEETNRMNITWQDPKVHKLYFYISFQCSQILFKIGRINCVAFACLLCY